MNEPVWREEPISKRHDRKAFDCGQPELNYFLARYARQNHEEGSTKTWVATPDGITIMGFYTISPASISYASMPPDQAGNLGRYDVPVYRLGRLARDLQHSEKGFGEVLFACAARRCARASLEVGGRWILIDAKNDRLADWYEGLGAHRLQDAPLSLVFPLDPVIAALGYRE